MASRTAPPQSLLGSQSGSVRSTRQTGFRCPLTDLAEDLGAVHGAITDIFLPDWLAGNVARLYTPLLVVALILHARNLASRRVPVAGAREA